MLTNVEEAFEELEEYHGSAEFRSAAKATLVLYSWPFDNFQEYR